MLKDKAVQNNGTNGLIHKGDMVILRDKDILRSNTETKGQYEKAMKELLIELNLLAWYEAIHFEVPKTGQTKSNVTDMYPPDFITNLFVGGKQVIIELHGADQQYFARIGRWRQQHGDRFYYILVKSCLDNASEVAVQVGKTGEHGEQVDEYWTMPKIREMRRGTFSKTGTQAWKERMREELGKFIEERTDKCEDWEAAAALINVRRAS